MDIHAKMKQFHNGNPITIHIHSDEIESHAQLERQQNGADHATIKSNGERVVCLDEHGEL